LAEHVTQIRTASDQPNSSTFLGFGRAYEFPKRRDMRKITSRLPEGSVICSPSLIAGKSHLESVLIQSMESWSRGIFLARNRSIDLLLRMSCQNQISKAIQASALESCKTVALFGLALDDTMIEVSERLIRDLGGERNDTLLELDSKKVKFLRSFHTLPLSVDTNKIPELLQERSAILVFPS
jgi:tRNA threonylcarbamoyladenosine modification (KEOPS) complex Cgi121 subunit